MPFTNEALRREIQKWVRADGCRVGRIASRTPLTLNMHLVEVVWSGIQSMAAKPMLIYVCNTTLEAEILDRRLKDRSFHGGQIGEQSVVSKTGHLPGAMVLLSYACFRKLLDHEAGTPVLPPRLVVVCEQEAGMNMDAVVSRGQFVLHARNTLSARPGSNVKMLGLSYKLDRGGYWLEHAVQIMSTAPLRLSLDRTVSYKSAMYEQPEKYTYDDESVLRCADDAADHCYRAGVAPL